MSTVTTHIKTEKELFPVLRFKEFEGDWKKSTLKKEAIVNPRTSELPEKFIYIDLESVTKGMLVKEEEIFLSESPSRAQRLLDKDDILYQTVRPYQKNNLYFDRIGDYVASTGYAQIKAKGDSKYLFQFLHTTPFVNVVNRWSTGTSYPAISPSELVKIPVAFPSLPEQQKIASFLFAVDEKIQQLTKKKELLKDYKKGVMQQLFSSQLRFKDKNGNPYPDWEEKRLGDVLEQQVREVPKPSVNYLAIGVRSHVKGTFQKPDSDPKKIAMEKLFIVNENDLVVNITFAWEGAIAIVKKEDEGGLVSHRFPTYTFREEQTSHDYFKQIIIDKKFRFTLDLISPGGAGRNRVLSKKEFVKIKWSFPCIEEQQKIATYLSSIDTKIEAVNNQIIQTQTFKKGILQQMFV
ncbi:MAG: restriction endonuclease subunit S [Bacteroidia bacterium]|nr:restriction endonuclease subunit S [Bacteroidia bacterium]